MEKSHVFRTSKSIFSHGCVLIILLVYSSVLAGCKPPPPVFSQPLDSDHFILDLHGSDLLPELAEAFLKQQKKAIRTNRIEVGVNHVVIQGFFPDARPPQGINIRIMYSTIALKHLAAGNCDIALTARPIKDEELQAFSPRLQNLRSPDNEHIVALDGIAVVVNRKNPLKRLKLDQLAGIFSGKIWDWAKVGGPHQPINIYTPDEDGGTSEAFRHTVLKDKPYPNSIHRVQPDVMLWKSIADDINGIGFMKFKYVRQVKTLAISDGESPSVRPDEFLVRTENYPLSHRLYLYVPEEPANPIAREFARFALSYEGQTIVALNNLVDQSLELVTSLGDARRVKKTRKLENYLTLRRKGEQLPVNIRFQLESSVPDNKARQDIDRIVEFLTHSEELRTHTVLLVGFAHNGALSKQGTQAIKHILKERITIPIEIMELGDALRVSSNQTKAGQFQNCRVEVWLLPSDMVASVLHQPPPPDVTPSPVALVTPEPPVDRRRVDRRRDGNSGSNWQPSGATVLKLNSKKPEQGFLNANTGDHTDWYELEISTEGKLTYTLKQQKGNATLIMRFYDVVQHLQELVEKQWIEDISLTGKSTQAYSIAGAKPGRYYAQVIVRNPGARSNYLITTAFVPKIDGFRGDVESPADEPPQPTPVPTAVPPVHHGELLPPEIEITSHQISSDQTIIVRDDHVKIEGRVEASRPIGRIEIDTVLTPFQKKEDCTSRKPCYVGEFSYEATALEVGVSTPVITITAWDQEGEHKVLRFRIFREAGAAEPEIEPATPETDSLPPVITITTPQDQTTTQHTITLEGRVEDQNPIVEILVDGSVPVSDKIRKFNPVLKTREFYTSVPLVPGLNEIEITARDKFGNTGKELFRIHRE